MIGTDVLRRPLVVISVLLSFSIAFLGLVTGRTWVFVVGLVFLALDAARIFLRRKSAAPTTPESLP